MSLDDFAEPRQPFDELKQKWKNWFEQPDNRAGLVQFGIQMLQPIAPGQTLAGQFGQAVGAAGEVVGRREDERGKRADQALNKKMGLAELGLRREMFASDAAFKEAQGKLDEQRIAREAEQMQFNREIGQQELGLQERQVRVAEENAETGRIGALTPSPRSVSSSKSRTEIRQEGIDQYNKAMAANIRGEPPVNPETGKPMTPEEYVDRYEQTVRVQEEQEATPTPTILPDPGMDLFGPAKPMLPANAPTPDPVNTRIDLAPNQTPVPATAANEMMSTSDLLASRPGIVDKLNTLLQSPDPVVKAKARLTLDKLKQYLTDPQNFPLK